MLRLLLRQGRPVQDGLRGQESRPWPGRPISPADCALLVVPGPVKDLGANELETIEGYLRGGGRVFFLVDPQTAPGLTPFLAKFGFKLDNDIIVDSISRLMGGDYFMPIVGDYESHEITKNFRYASLFPLVRSVEPIEPKPEGVVSSQSLAKTSANSYAKKDFVLKARMTLKEIGFDQKRQGRPAVGGRRRRASKARPTPAAQNRRWAAGRDRRFRFRLQPLHRDVRQRQPLPSTWPTG